MTARSLSDITAREVASAEERQEDWTHVETRTADPQRSPVAQQIVRQSRHRGAGVLGAAAVGVALALQSRINGTLGSRLEDGLAAATVSFAIGLLVLVGCVAVLPRARRGLRRIAGEVRSGTGLRPWECLGGVCGAGLVFSQGISADALGVALFTVVVVAGQVVNGLVVDRLGLGPGAPQYVTPTRVVGAGLVVVAVLIAMSGRLGDTDANWLVLLPALAGVGVAWQQAVNGKVKQTADSVVASSTLNFAVGTSALLVAFLADVAVRGLPRALPTEAWLYAGGVLGVFVIGAAAVLVRYTGVLVLSMGMIAGQLVGALLLDLVVPAPGTHVGASTLIGITLTLVAVGVAAFPDRAVRRAASLPR